MDHNGKPNQIEFIQRSTTMFDGRSKIVTNAPMRILIVDDEPYNLLSLKIILETADKSGKISGLIDEAINGEKAYKKVKEGFTS